MPYLLDTNVFISALRKPKSHVAQRLRSFSADELVLSTVVLGELLTPLYKGHASKQRQQISQLAEYLPVLGIGAQEAREYATIRAELELAGTRIGANDLWIAAQACANDLVLVTANTREFERVRNLRLENWEPYR